MKMIKRIKIGIVIITLFSFIFSASYLAFANELHTISMDIYGCTSKKYYRKLSSYIVDSDMVAFQKALITGIAAGICTMFKKGEKVYIVDSAYFSGMAKVRRPGKTIEYWTLFAAVK